MAALAWAPQWHWSPASCLLGGLSFYLLHNTLQANATQMLPSMRGTAVSLFASSLFCGQSVGVVVAAWIADLGSLQSVFAASALLLPALGAWFGSGLARRDEWQRSQADR
jgi:MFS family permease